MGGNDIMVNQRGEQVHEEDRQHNAFGEACVNDADDDDQHADQETVDPFSLFCLCCTHWIGGHEYGSESKPTEEKMLPEGNLHQCIPAEGIQYQSHHCPSGKDREHDLQTSDPGIDQYKSSYQDGQSGCFPYGTGNGSNEHFHWCHGITGGIQEGFTYGGLPQRSGPTETIYHAFSFQQTGDPHGISRHERRIGKKQECPGSQGRIQDIHTRLNKQETYLRSQNQKINFTC